MSYKFCAHRLGRSKVGGHKEGRSFRTLKSAPRLATILNDREHSKDVPLAYHLGTVRFRGGVSR